VTPEPISSEPFKGGAEHRRHSRARPRLSVRVQPDGGDWLDGVLKDVSYSGICVELEHHGLLSGSCRVEILLGDGTERISLQGEIVRDVNNDVAVKKTEALSLQSDAHLRRLIQLNSADVARVEDEFSSPGLKNGRA